MRRLVRTLFNVWVAFFLPSVIVWGLMVRWSARSAARFETSWQWTVDRLGYPLLFAPLSDWCWQGFHSGIMWRAATGFTVLAGLWSLILTLPLVLIGSWWVWLTRRTSPASSSTITSYRSTNSYPVDSDTPSWQSPMGVVYLITIPLALIWAGVVKLTHSLFGDSHPIMDFIRPILWAFLIPTALYLIYLSLMWTHADSGDPLTAINYQAGDVWWGYLETLRIPRIFQQQWFDALQVIYLNAHHFTPFQWEVYTSEWYRQPELRTFSLITSARHGVAVAEVALVLQVVRRVVFSS